MKTRISCPLNSSVRLAALVAALNCAVVSGAATPAAVSLRDGVLVDDTKVYAMRPGGGIEALTLADGVQLWSNDAADRPVAATRETLLAQRDGAKQGTLTLVLMASDSGDDTAVSNLALPAHVLASVDNRLDSRFEIQPVATGGADELVWRYDYQKVQGAPTGAAMARQRGAAGVIEVTNAGDGALQLRAASRAAPERAAHSRVASVGLAGPGERAFYSEDRQHVLVTHRVADSRAYAWRVHDLDGQLLGEARSRASFSPFVVRDGVLLFVAAPFEHRRAGSTQTVPLTLRAIDLGSGKEKWSRPVRDTRYGGPFPP